jgi:hypothetical protein
MPTAWVTLAAADIEARLPSTFLATVRERLVDAQADPMVALLADITARVRGAVASCDDYRLDANTATVPPELKDTAAWLVVEALYLRFGEATPIPEGVAKRIERSNADLEKVAACDLAVSDPVTPEASPSAQATGGATVVRAHTRYLTRERTDGL